LGDSNIEKISILSKFKTDLIQFVSKFQLIFCRHTLDYSKFTWKGKRTSVTSKIILKKKEKLRGISLPNFKIYHIVTIYIK
jgi:hypothetical protein